MCHASLVDEPKVLSLDVPLCSRAKCLVATMCSAQEWECTRADHPVHPASMIVCSGPHVGVVITGAYPLTMMSPCVFQEERHLRREECNGSQ
jgi:hypothetical protein